MGDFVTSLVMVVFLFARGTVISAEGQNATDNFLQELLDGTQVLPTVGPKNDVSAIFKSHFMVISFCSFIVLYFVLICI